MLHYTQVEQVVRLIAPYVHGDPHVGQDGFYKVSSLYYDSPQLMCYWEKIDGEKFRRKLRIRIYDKDSGHAFLEIKQRYDRTVQKRRHRASLEHIQQQMRRISKGGYTKSEEPIFDEAFILVRQFALEPKIIVSYNRMAFFDKHKKDLRITIDRNIKCRNLSLDLTEKSTKGRYTLPPTMMILEVKFNDLIPTWLCSCLNSLDLQLQRVSKYCYSIESRNMHLSASSRASSLAGVLASARYQGAKAHRQRVGAHGSRVAGRA